MKTTYRPGVGGHRYRRIVAPAKSITVIGFEDFEAYYKAKTYLTARGFSLGETCAGLPCGILFGRIDIAKWRHLRTSEIEALHGKLTGDRRRGPLVIHLHATAPPAAHKAFTIDFPEGGQL